jgi:putative membrane protein
MKINRIILSLILIPAFLLPIYNIALAGWGEKNYGYSGGHMMGLTGPMGPGYMGWFMILFWGVLLVALIILIRWVAQLPHGKESSQRTIKSPLDILKERLARGEIEIDEYMEKKQLL